MNDQLTAEVVRRRIAEVRAEIAQLTDRSVRIVGVTKTHPDDVVVAALQAGLVDLGENYAQDLRARAGAAPILATGVAPRWHFIGQLQSNKVRLIAGDVWCWQTVDRSSIIAEIARRDPGARIMVQVDLAGIPGRGGCRIAEVSGLVGEAGRAGLAVIGLMAVGVPGPPELSRTGFAQVVRTAEDLGLAERSIGMSGDYRVAVEEGSTMVRLGSLLFGDRRVRGASSQ